MSKKNKSFLVAAGFFAASLLFLSFWIIYQKSGNPVESLMVRNVVISTDLSDRLRITGYHSRFPYGTRQVSLRFDYSKAARDEDIKVLWFMGERLVQSGNYALTGTSGSKLLSLTRRNNQILPRGLYSIAMLNDTERLSNFRFEIY